MAVRRLVTRGLLGILPLVTVVELAHILIPKEVAVALWEQGNLLVRLALFSFGLSRFVAAHAVVWGLWVVIGLALASWVLRVEPQRLRRAFWRMFWLALPVTALHAGLVLVVLLNLPGVGGGYFPIDYDPLSTFALYQLLVRELGSYLLVAGFSLALVYFVDARDASARADRARMHALRLQLEPHFLFNVLNSVVVLTRQGNIDLASDMLTQLAELLRSTLDEDDRTSVTLREEVAFTRRYAELERMRFGDRLQIEFAIEDDAAQSSVPVRLLQPLVENAVRHGPGSREAGGTVSVAAKLEHGYLVLRVDDDGPGFPTFVHEGIGLGNTRERLGATGELSCGQSPSGGASVHVRIPQEAAP